MGRNAKHLGGTDLVAHEGAWGPRLLLSASFPAVGHNDAAVLAVIKIHILPGAPRPLRVARPAIFLRALQFPMGPLVGSSGDLCRLEEIFNLASPKGPRRATVSLLALLLFELSSVLQRILVGTVRAHVFLRCLLRMYTALPES